MGETVGYARVSTDDQRLDLQLDALHAAGCARIFEDHASGAKADRPGLTAALDYLRSGDTLTVWKLDRLARSLRQLVTIMADLERRQIGFTSVSDQIDTTTPTGRFVLHILGSLAELEREILRERTRAGLAAARARGRKGGHPPKLNARQRQRAKELHDSRTMTAAEIARTVGCSRSTLYRSLAGTV